MKKKLTIRRVGTIIPTICLVVFLLLCIAVVWLSTVGLPSGVIRSIEEKALAAGVPLRIEKICLAPSKGLALEAENICIYEDAQCSKLLAKVDSAAVSLHASKLLTGKLQVDTLELHNGNISLPVTDTAGNSNLLTAQEIAISATLKEDILILTGASLKLQGVPIHLQGGFSIAELMKGKTAEEETKKIVLPALIKTCQHIIDRTYNMIQEQHWSNSEYPELHLRIFALDELTLRVEANVPKYDIDKFQFRDTRLDLNYEGDRLIINNLYFKTVSPDTETVLQAGYEINTRKLSFDLKSSADVLYMLSAIAGEETKKTLSKIQYADDNTPQVELGGTIEFEEDFTLRNIDVKGVLEHKNLRVDSMNVNEVGVSFFYKNGDFNISNMRLLFDNGNINLSANVTDGVGSAALSAQLPVSNTISLINSFKASPIALPIGLKLGESVHLEAKTNFRMPIFHPGQEYKLLIIPTFSNIDVTVKLNELAYVGQTLVNPQLTLSCTEPRWTPQAELSTIEQLHLALEADSIALERPEFGKIDLSKPRFSLEATGLNMQAEGELLTAANAKLTAASDALASTAGSAQAWNTELTAVGFKLSPEYTPSADSTEVKLTAKAYSYGDYRTGKLTLAAQQSCTEQEQNPLLYYFSHASLQASVEDICHGDKALGDMSVQLAQPRTEGHNFTLIFTPEHEQERKATITANAELTPQLKLKLTEAQAELPLAAMEEALQCAGAQTSLVELPEQLTIKGEATVDLHHLSLDHAACNIDIPRLVRTPEKLLVNRGKKIPVELHTTLNAHTNEQGDLAYTGELTLIHSTGTATVDFNGSTAGSVKVAMDSTIRADIIDELLDLEDAHSIIRDFKFNNKSKTVLKNATASVDFSNGLCVEVDCDINVSNAQFQLNGILVDEQGKERLNPAMGKLPFVSVSSATTHLHAKRREDVKEGDTVLPTINTLTMSNVKLVYDNRPWLALQDFSALGLKKQTKPATSELKGDRVVIDIENGLLTLKNVSGSVFPAYSIGMFFGELREHLNDVLLPYPVKLSTDSCNIPIYKECKEHMKGHIRVQSDNTCGFKFIGTTIPFTRFTGFISLHDDYIFLDRMNARCWDGTLDAAVKIGISGEHTSFDGQVTAQNMNLKKIAAAYKADMSTALCTADMRFRSPTSDVDDLQAYGKIRVVNGDLLNLGIFHPIAALVSDIRGNLRELDDSAKKNQFTNLLKGLRKIPGKTVHAIGRNVGAIPGYNHIFAYDLQDAYAEYTIQKGKFQTSKFKSTGYNLKVTGNLSIDLDSLELYGNMWPEISSLPTIILSPLTFLSDFMVDIVLYGKIDDIQWKFKLDHRLRGKSPVTATSATPSDNPAPRKKR